jgi:methylglutaconyl-CoA hydratase
VCSLPDEEIQDVTTQLIARLRISDEGQEGLKAFIEKRKPGWVFHEPQDEDEE